MSVDIVLCTTLLYHARFLVVLLLAYLERTAFLFRHKIKEMRVNNNQTCFRYSEAANKLNIICLSAP